MKAICCLLAISLVFSMIGVAHGQEPFQGFPAATLRTVADINGDGVQEVLQLVTEDDVPIIRVYTIVDNAPQYLDGWPRSLDGSTGFVPPAVGEVMLDHEGPEIVAVTYGGGQAEIYVLGTDGIVLLHATYPNLRPRDLALADLDGDGDHEIIIAGIWSYTDGAVIVFQEDGTVFGAGWPVILETELTNFVQDAFLAVGDLDGDGDQEIVYTDWVHPPGIGLVGPSRIQVFNADGSVPAGWEESIVVNPANRPVLADLYNDGRLEIIVSTWGVFFSQLHIYSASGQNLGRETVGYWAKSPVVGDLNNDGLLEIVVSDAGFCRTFVFDRYLSLLRLLDPGGGEVALADVDADGIVEIVTAGLLLDGSNLPVIHALKYTDGSEADGWPVMPDGFIRGAPDAWNFMPVIGNFDSDDGLEVLIGNTLIQTATEYDPLGMEWPAYQANPQHTGRYELPCPDDAGGPDCSSNGIPDVCEPDCNHNDIADSCDIAAGTSDDCTGNGIPDECEFDCNDNGQADSCDILEGVSEDCNQNGRPDECPEDDAPDIFGQPQDVQVDQGDFAFFAVNVDGILTEYQWRKDGQPLSDTERVFGTNLPMIVILDVMPGDAGLYDCVVTTFFVECVSDSALLTVTEDCTADFDDDGAVGPFDLALVLGFWGPNPDHPADLNGDGVVGPFDLALLLLAWGPCP